MSVNYKSQITQAVQQRNKKGLEDIENAIKAQIEKHSSTSIPTELLNDLKDVQ